MMLSRVANQPQTLLAPYVSEYWAMIRDRSEVPFTVTPDRFVEFLIFTEPPLLRAGGNERRLPRAFVIPLLERPFELIMDRPLRCASIRFHGSIGAFLTSASDVSPCFRPRPDLLELVPAIVAALERGAWSDIVRRFDRALLELFASRPPDAVSLAPAEAFLASPSGSRVRASDIANEFGYSRRQIERRVYELTQRSPKQLSSLSRFHFVRDALWARTEIRLEALALEAGYADQAHLSRDFRRYAGLSPRSFRRVAFVQDSGADGH